MSCLIIEDDARFREVKAKIKATKTSNSTKISQKLFTRVGNFTLHYNDTSMTYFQARKKCHDLGATLVEMRTEDEWNEVKTQPS